jgi:hypothetical protein
VVFDYFADNNMTMDEKMDRFKKLLGSLQVIRDPKIKVQGQRIIISPFYFNYTFITNFFPVMVASYILIKQDNQNVDLLCVFIILISAFLVLNQLRYYGITIIDTEKKSISVKPSFAYQLLSKKKVILFDEVKKFDSALGTPWTAVRRYHIFLILRNGEKVKISSTATFILARRITHLLSVIVH